MFRLIAFLSLPAILSAQPKPEGWPLGARIPEISGRVVDALTGKAVGNVDITLRATSLTASFGDGGRDPVRYDNIRTTPKGDFVLRSTLQPELAKLLTSLENYWLSVNLGPPAEQSRAANFDNDRPFDMIADDMSYQITSAPFLIPRYPHHRYTSNQQRPWSDRHYFPMAIQFVHPCQQKWNANCVFSSATRKLKIRLIPVLDGADACKPIKDRNVRQQCRELNGYWAAFRQTETVEQFRADKELCGRIDPGAVVKICLDNLRGLDPDLFEGRWTAQHQLGQTMVLVPVAGLVPMGVNTFNRPNRPEFYALQYLWTEHERGLESCMAYVWQASTADDEFAAFREILAIVPGATPHIERVGGQPYVVGDLPDRHVAYWTSRDAVVAIVFWNAAHYIKTYGEKRAHAAEATSEMRAELIRQYILKHPVTPPRITSRSGQ
jgi:hypothetical protein